MSNPEKLYDPVQLLIEIGIEKLKNDYTQAFVVSKVALADNLKLEYNNKFSILMHFFLFYTSRLFYFKILNFFSIISTLNYKIY